MVDTIIDSDVLPDNATSKTEILKISHNGVQVNLEFENILCIYRSGKKLKSLTRSLSEYEFVGTIGAIAGQGKEYNILQINRSVAINLLAIKGYEHGGKRDTLKLIIKPKYKHDYPVFSSIEYIVTKEYIEPFKDQFISIEKN